MGATARPAGLEQGTIVRSRRAALKRSIEAGKVDVVEILKGDAREDVETVALDMTVDALLRAIPGVGWVTVQALAETADVETQARLSTLTIARRRALAGALGKEIAT